MSSQKLVCTGCGCLCDDINAEVGAHGLTGIENACTKGVAYLSAAFNEDRRTASLIRGEKCLPTEAINEARSLLAKAERPLIFGLDCSTCEAQQQAINLARKRQATIDDASSSSYGSLIQSILSGGLPTCAFSEVKDNADLLVYWGSDAPNTHPRHLSKYTYYAYTDFDKAGWYPKVVLGCIDIRNSELCAMSNMAIKLRPGQDGDFMRAVLDDTHSVSEDANKFRERMKKSRFCVFFCGLGLVHSLGSDLSPLPQMMEALGQSTRIALMPMISEINLRGFTQKLYEDTGYVNQVSFAGGVLHSSDYSLHEQLRNNTADCVILIDSDPYRLLPHQLMRNLRNTRVIYLGPFKTPVASLADVVIATAIPGIEQGGSVLRMDGIEIDLLSVRETRYPTQQDVLAQLMDAA